MINEVVEFCRGAYSKDDACADCNNNCRDSCSACLKEIHYTSGCTRKYNCYNMCYWYVCQNMHKYASEIYYLLGSDVLELNRRQSDNPLIICSIGCGPASELVAIEEFRRRHNENLQYTFKGFDFNEYWNPIQSFVKRQSSSPDSISFYRQDVFDYYRDSVVPNVIILNYMLSDMLKMNFAGFDGFLENLYNLIQRMPSGMLLINDINIGLNIKNVRYYYDRIAAHVSKGKRNVKVQKYYFDNTYRRPFEYGTLQPNNSMVFQVPDNITREFNPNTECHSAQLLILKPRSNL